MLTSGSDFVLIDQDNVAKPNLPPDMLSAVVDLTPGSGNVSYPTAIPDPSPYPPAPQVRASSNEFDLYAIKYVSICVVRSLLIALFLSC